MRGNPNLEGIETTELCSYGCGKIAKYRFKSGKICCEMSPNKCEEVRRKNSESLKKTYNEGRGYFEYTSDIRKRISVNTKNAWDIRMEKIRSETPINLLTKNQQIKILSKKQEKRCSKCGLNTWMSKPLVLELHHINDNKKVDSIDDITLLCPNCHSQTENWKGRNKKYGGVS